MPRSRSRNSLIFDVDQHVALRLRQRRIMVGMSQTDLAKALGVALYQATKYGNGENRISAGMLYRIAQALGVDVTYFYQGLPPPIDPTHPSDARTEFARDVSSIPHAEQQHALLHLARVLAKAESGEDENEER